MCNDTFLRALLQNLDQKAFSQQMALFSFYAVELYFCIESDGSSFEGQIHYANQHILSFLVHRISEEAAVSVAA